MNNVTTKSCDSCIFVPAMKRFKERWEITKNWQLIHPILGSIALVVSGFLIAKGVLNKTVGKDHELFYQLLGFFTVVITILLLYITLWFFKKLYTRWKVTYRWELIAIFLVFAVTGSTAGRISDPVMELIGLHKETLNGWIYWPVRILLIFPLYQVLLVIFGWIFGQYNFFKDFAVNMISRMGFGFLFKK